MHRKPLLDLLASYVRAFPAEEHAVSRITRLVSEHSDCFDRSCRPGHLTGSAWVVSGDGERHLLLWHRKLEKWLQPGGHADGDPNVAAVARREAEEETGLRDLRLVADPRGMTALDVDVHLIPARIDADGAVIDDAHEHHDVRFLFQTTGSEVLSGNDESDGLRWCRPEEVRSLTDEESVLRLLDKAVERLRLTP